MTGRATRPDRSTLSRRVRGVLSPYRERGDASFPRRRKSRPPATSTPCAVRPLYPNLSLMILALRALAADRMPPVGGSIWPHFGLIQPQIGLKTPRFGPELASSAAGAQE